MKVANLCLIYSILHSCCLRLVSLRIYPPKFALKIAKLYKRFCSTHGLWFGTKLEDDNWELTSFLFDTLKWDEADWWHDASTQSVFIYLRGARDFIIG